MAPDSVGTWWCEDTERQRDNPTTQSWMPPTPMPPTSTTSAKYAHTHTAKTLKRNALEIYLEAIDWNETEDVSPILSLSLSMR